GAVVFARLRDSGIDLRAALDRVGVVRQAGRGIRGLIDRRRLAATREGSLARDSAVVADLVDRNNASDTVLLDGRVVAHFGETTLRGRIGRGGARHIGTSLPHGGGVTAGGGVPRALLDVGPIVEAVLLNGRRTVRAVLADVGLRVRRALIDRRSIALREHRRCE